MYATTQDIQSIHVGPRVVYGSGNYVGVPFKDWLSNNVYRNISKDHLYSEARIVQPADAAHILEVYNTRNRPVRPHKVETYARVLRNGGHLLTHQGISFSRTGKLNNGQNRLSAIIKTGIAANLYFTFGESDDAFDVIDDNSMSKRSHGDTLAVAGFANAKTVAAICAMIEGRADDLGGLKKKTLGNHEVKKFAEANKEALVGAATEARAVASKLKCGAGSLGYALYLIVERSKHIEKKDSRLFNAFLACLIDPSQSPEIVASVTPLRDGLMKWALDERFRSGTDKRYAQAAAVIKCWNNLVTGKKKPILWRVGETFPVPA